LAAEASIAEGMRALQEGVKDSGYDSDTNSSDSDSDSSDGDSSGNDSSSSSTKSSSSSSSSSESENSDDSDWAANNRKQSTTTTAKKSTHPKSRGPLHRTTVSAAAAAPVSVPTVVAVAEKSPPCSENSPVVQICPATGRVVAKFVSMTAAAEAMNVSPTLMYCCCTGTLKFVRDYFFRVVDECHMTCLDAAAERSMDDEDSPPSPCTGNKDTQPVDGQAHIVDGVFTYDTSQVPIPKPDGQVIGGRTIRPVEQVNHEDPDDGTHDTTADYAGSNSASAGPVGKEVVTGTMAKEVGTQHANSLSVADYLRTFGLSYDENCDMIHPKSRGPSHRTTGSNLSVSAAASAPVSVPTVVAMAEKSPPCSQNAPVAQICPASGRVSVADYLRTFGLSYDENCDIIHTDGRSSEQLGPDASDEEDEAEEDETLADVIARHKRQLKLQRHVYVANNHEGKDETHGADGWRGSPVEQLDLRGEVLAAVAPSSATGSAMGGDAPFTSKYCPGDGRSGMLEVQGDTVDVSVLERCDECNEDDEDDEDSTLGDIIAQRGKRRSQSSMTSDHSPLKRSSCGNNVMDKATYLRTDCASELVAEKAKKKEGDTTSISTTERFARKRSHTSSGNCSNVSRIRVVYDLTDDNEDDAPIPTVVQAHVSAPEVYDLGDDDDE
jgi:hypothetical protein